EDRIDRMKRQGRRLYEEHQNVTARLADLAAALGACGLCWGEDEFCPSCRGRGRPGMVRPDPELRARLLGPFRVQPAAQAEPPTRSNVGSMNPVSWPCFCRCSARRKPRRWAASTTSSSILATSSRSYCRSC